ncbi:MAG: NAD(P)-dependent oxidoreductase [Solirubrobacteraceae bacterium]
MDTPTAAPVALVGLGRMGMAACARLAGAGHTVIATDIDPRTEAPARRAGARWVPRAAQAAAGAAVVITLLPGAAEVGALAAELTAAMAPGAIWIEMSTAAPPTARTVTAAAARSGARVLDAPVGGDPSLAAEGRLLCFVGGATEVLQAARPILAALADRIVHVGPAGAGYAVKLLANSLWFGQAVATAEALTLADRAGLDPEVVRAALAQSAAGGRFLTHDAPALLRGDDLASFPLARCCEQLAAVLALGDELSVPLELAAATAAVHHQALAHYGERDGELLGARFVAERSAPDQVG